MTFLNSIFTFLIHKSMEDNDSQAKISAIRQICIDPSKFNNYNGQGKQSCIKKYKERYLNTFTKILNKFEFKYLPITYVI